MKRASLIPGTQRNDSYILHVVIKHLKNSQLKLIQSIIGFALVLVCSCLSVDQNDVSEIDLEKILKNKKPVTSLKEVAKDITYIPLETNQECLINGSVRQVLIHNNNVLVLDGDGKTCYVFNMQGKFETKFIKQGNGPLEVIRISDMSYSSNFDRIYALDVMSKKIIVCSTEFEPQYEFQTNIRTRKMSSFNNLIAYVNMSLDYDGSKLLLSVTDSDGNVVNSIESNRNPDWKIGLNYRSIILYEYDKKLIYKDKWCDTLYSMSPSFDIAQHMVLKLGKYKNTPDYHDTSGITGVPVSKKGLYDISWVTELTNYLYINLGDTYIVYNKNTKKLSTFSFDEKNGKEIWLTNDFDGGPSLNPRFKIDNNTIACAVNPIDYDFNNRSFVKKHPWARNVKIDDNPVLMIVKHK